MIHTVKQVRGHSTAYRDRRKEHDPVYFGEILLVHNCKAITRSRMKRMPAQSPAKGMELEDFGSNIEGMEEGGVKGAVANLKQREKSYEHIF